MKRVAMLCLLTAATGVLAQDKGLTGKWTATVDFFGAPLYWQMELKQEGEKLTVDFSGDKGDGTYTGGKLYFLAKDTVGGSEELTATVVDGKIVGNVIWKSGGDPDHKPYVRKFTAERNPERPTGQPKTHEFEPTVFRKQFSALYDPVLRINPGDTIHTWTVDAGGSDARGLERSLGGNPQTGPFYVVSAMPGDTLVVHINKLKLNRDYAISGDGIVPRGMDGELATKMKDAGKGVRWHLDLERGLASPENPGEHMKNYTVPVRPMLGCIAVATRPSNAAPGTGDDGYYGGNMDFNEITEGATVYLPIQVPGALLYFGDAHAVQGDGETTGDALETSMDVTLTVDIIPGKHPPEPRIENATHIMAMGENGSVDEALKEATANMAGWLMDEYKLTPSEVGMVFGTAAEYRISEIADRNAGVVLKISKERLKGLTKEPAK
ncbi:acetamidase/formamidase family protein [Terriglobus tenax]|uniref:acetamidase/formamidase family protein n=1 Tax=Terriglobus tenax TaxID=1111115 RepID=UPI0021DFFB77|nr:acetamidase/formamidase family protein [Terriglobus tenax]